jgi:hypothetical protein
MGNLTDDEMAWRAFTMTGNWAGQQPKVSEYPAASRFQKQKNAMKSSGELRKNFV